MSFSKTFGALALFATTMTASAQNKTALRPSKSEFMQQQAWIANAELGKAKYEQTKVIAMDTTLPQQQAAMLFSAKKGKEDAYVLVLVDAAKNSRMTVSASNESYPTDNQVSKLRYTWARSQMQGDKQIIDTVVSQIMMSMDKEIADKNASALKGVLEIVSAQQSVANVMRDMWALNGRNLVHIREYVEGEKKRLALEKK